MQKVLKLIFKKFTLFDIILVLIFLSGIVFFASTFFRKPVYVTATVKIGEDDVAYLRSGSRTWFAQLFHNGMMERDGMGKPQVEIINTLTYDTEANRQAVYLTLKIRALYTKATKQYTYKGKPILVGYPIKLQLDYINAEGLITNVEGVDDPREDVTLQIETQIMFDSNFLETTGSREFIADSISIGDDVKDSNGNTAISVIDKKVLPAKKVVTTSSGEVLIKTNPLLKDTYLTLIVHAKKVNGKYYMFDDVPLLIGKTVPLNTPFLSIGPVITKITEQKK